MSGCTGLQSLRALVALRSAGSVCSRAPLVQRHCYSTQLAQKDDGAATGAPAENPWTKLRTSTLKTGLIISSVEDENCPVSKISVAVKAGARYETPETSGITHCLRIGAELSNTGTSGFLLVKTLGQLGASLQVSTSRDHMVYTVRCLRDHVEEALDLVGNILAGPTFHLWEMPAVKPRMLFEAAMVADNPTVQLFEMLHDVAYRGTSVGRSLYCPVDMAGSHTPDMLTDFVLDHYKIGSMAVSGVSVPHEMLGELAQLAMAEVAPGKGPAPPAATYGGGEARKHVASSQVARVALAVEGAGVNDAKHSIALALLQQHIGDGPRTNFSLPTNRMSESVAKVAKSPATVTGVNIAHSDTGLFGATCTGAWRDMDAVVPVMMDQLREIAQRGLTDKQVKVAKERVKSLVLSELETSEGALDYLAQAALAGGEVPKVADLLQDIDGLSAGDLNNIAKKVLGGKMSLAAVGNLQATPYLDKLA